MSTPWSIPDLTRSIRGGDPDALTALYRSRFDALLSSAQRRTRRDESTCLDLVQETFMRVIRALPVLESEAQLDAWLHRALDRAALDLLRAERRRRRREERRGHAGDGGAESASHHPAAWSERLRTLLSELPESTRDLLDARFRFGWTLSRIGSLAGLAPGAVDGRLSRTIDRLRMELDDEPPHA